MTDVLTPQQRSFCMSHNKGRDTEPEIRLRKELWKRGLRYRVCALLPGRPDIVFPRARIAVFVDGCFWHGCPKHGVMPKNNAGFWAKKITRTKERDRQNESQLRMAGWQVLRFWEHEIRADLTRAAEIISISMRQTD